VVLGHESYRDGLVLSDNVVETRRAVRAHTEMADRMRSAGVDIDLSGLIGGELALYDIARSLGDMSLMDKYADLAYDSSEDFWKLTKDENGMWGWDKDGKADFDISEALKDRAFLKQLVKNQDRSLMDDLYLSKSLDGKDSGVISAGRMNSAIASQIAFSAYLPSMGIYRNKDNTFQVGPNQENESFMHALWRETMYFDNFNKEHTTTVYDNNKPKTLWNIDNDNIILDELMKQSDDRLKIIDGMASYGCNFMVITGYAQMITGSVLGPEQVKKLWNQSISDEIMDANGWVKDPSELGTMTLKALGISNLEFEAADTLGANTTLLGYRIGVPYLKDENGLHYTLGDINKNLIYNPGRTWDAYNQKYRGVGIRVKN
jgi:hypothetical protein